MVMYGKNTFIVTTPVEVHRATRKENGLKEAFKKGDRYVNNKSILRDSKKLS